MALIFDLTSKLAVILLIFLTAAFVIVIYYKWTFKRWENKFSSPWTPRIPFGHIPNVFRVDINIESLFGRFYNKLKNQGHKCGILFWGFRPVYVAIHPDHIKNLIVRDYDYFEDRGINYNETKDPLIGNLTAAKGEKWRKLRAKLTPAFTPGALKLMFDNMLQCCQQMQDTVENLLEIGRKAIDITEIAGCYTTDIIGSCAFGVECNSFKDPTSEFRRHGKNVLLATTPFKIAKFSLIQMSPKFSQWLGLTVADKDTTNFFMNLVRETIKFRKAHDVVRKDVLQFLLKSADDEFDVKANIERAVKELTPQVFLFFMAGYHTSYVALSLCLYELAINLDLQEKLRDEVQEVLLNHKGVLNYETIMDMKYMNQVIEETLRKYPSVNILIRECTKDYQLLEPEVIIKKGMLAVVPIISLHRDPEYYPQPEKFDPDRFTDENKRNRPAFTYLPLGEGPKFCIGGRFFSLQMKIALSVLLQHYKFSLNEKTELPVKFNPHPVLLMPKTIVLDVEKLRK